MQLLLLLLLLLLLIVIMIQLILTTFIHCWYYYFSFFWLGESSIQVQVVVAPEAKALPQRLWSVWRVTRIVDIGRGWTRDLHIPAQHPNHYTVAALYHYYYHYYYRYIVVMIITIRIIIIILVSLYTIAISLLAAARQARGAQRDVRAVGERLDQERLD